MDYIPNGVWFPIKRGGGIRKWYGNQEHLINWKNNGKEIKKYIEQKGGYHYSRQKLSRMKIGIFSRVFLGAQFLLQKRDLGFILKALSSASSAPNNN